MTDTMRDRLARALYEADRAPHDPPWYRWDSGVQAAAFRCADAAISELRVPSKEMIEAMCSGVDAFTLLPDEAVRIWAKALNAIGEKT